MAVSVATLGITVRRLGLSPTKLILFFKRHRSSSDAGFTLIEILVALAIFAIVLGVAVLAIPNHDKRYFQDNLDQLVSSLNMAQEESAMTGMQIVAQVDSTGWRFYSPNANVFSNVPLALNGVGTSTSATSGLMPDVYRPHAWYQPVEMATLQLTLGGEQVRQALHIPIKQEDRQAILLRSSNGRFSWTSSSTP